MDDEEVIRRILEAEAARVEVSPDALTEIRRRIATRRGAPALPAALRRWWRRPHVWLALGSGGLAAASLATLVAGVVSCQPTRSSAPPLQPGGSRTPAASQTAVAHSADPAPDRTATAAVGPAVPGPTGGATANLAVYYLGTDRSTREDGQPVRQLRLYREFHRLRVGDGSTTGKVRAALAAMLDGRTAQDPDYTSGWPAGARVRDVQVAGDTVTVDLTAVGTRGTSQAVQQLVWTVTAASGRPEVRLLLDGRVVDTLWGGVPVGGVLRRAPAIDVLARVWLINPQHGETVGRGFEVHVYGSVFESTVRLRVRQGDRTVTETFLTLSPAGAASSAPGGTPGQVGDFGEARKELTLPPGRYVLEAYEASAVDDSPQHLDDHAVTVT